MVREETRHQPEGKLVSWGDISHVLTMYEIEIQIMIVVGKTLRPGLLIYSYSWTFI